VPWCQPGPRGQVCGAGESVHVTTGADDDDQGEAEADNSPRSRSWMDVGGQRAQNL
jgi:hypothetical protein